MSNQMIPPSPTHEEVQARFSDYSEGELSETEAGMVKSHLAKCDSCRREYEGFLGALWKVSELRTQTPDAPQRFLESVQGRIRARSQGRFFSRKRVWSRFPLETVSLITLLVLLITYVLLVAMQPNRVQEVLPGPGREGGASGQR